MAGVAEHAPAVMASYTVGVWLRNPATKETRPAQQGLAIPAMPFDDAGRLRVDGLEPGDWVPTFNYPLRCGPPMENPLEGWGTCRVELSTVTALQPNELRIVDLDLSGYQPGTLQASVVLNGHARPDGAVLLWPIESVGAPLPKFQVNLPVDVDGHFSATLPPARYLAKWFTFGKAAYLPLGEFTVVGAQHTEHIFVVDVVDVAVRVLDVDGGPAPPGSVLLERAGLRSGGYTDATGSAIVVDQLRGDTLRVSFCPRIGELPNGKGNFGPPIALGELTAGATSEAVTLRLPKQ